MTYSNWKFDNELRLLAAAQPVGTTRQVQCPACNKERKLAITVETDKILYCCFRASCGFRGALNTVSNTEFPLGVGPTPDTAYRGQLYQLEAQDSDYFWQRFGVADAHKYISLAETFAYVFDIKDPLGRSRGWHVRRPTWGGAPSPPRPADLSAPKSKTYLLPDEIGLSWYRPDPSRASYNSTLHGRVTIVIVEDPISAIKLSQLPQDVLAVALLGCELNQQYVYEIQKQQSVELPIILALDADATGKALAHARKWGPALPGLRVAILKRDIKDTCADDIAEELGLGYA